MVASNLNFSSQMLTNSLKSGTVLAKAYFGGNGFTVFKFCNCSKVMDPKFEKEFISQFQLKF